MIGRIFSVSFARKYTPECIFIVLTGSSALPAGQYINKKFESLGGGTVFWTSRERDYSVSFLVVSKKAFFLDDPKSHGSGFSVRCVKD